MEDDLKEPIYPHFSHQMAIDVALDSGIAELIEDIAAKEALLAELKLGRG